MKDVPKEPIALPIPELYWDDINVNDEKILDEVRTRLSSFIICSLIIMWRTMIVPIDSIIRESF